MKEKRNVCLGRLMVYMSLVIVLSFTYTTTTKAAAEKEGRVLFISSYSYAWDTVQMQIEGIKDTLGTGITLDYEFMDTKRVNTEESERLFYEGLKYRLSMVEPYDVVIVGDDAALIFAMEYREELFAGIPIIFEGVNDETLARESSEDPLVTGVVEKLSLPENIELGLALNPNADKVVAILDDSITGQAERERFYKYAGAYPNLTFTEINTSQLSTAKLTMELASIDKNSILIYVVMTEDADGKQYDSLESVQLIANKAKVPCLRMVEAGIGEGLLGGNVVSMYKSGEVAAGMAKDIIRGRDCSEIEMVAESPNVYCVDEQVMKKFNLDMGRLPEGTTILNHEASFIERNQESMRFFGALLIALLVFTLWIFIDNLRRRSLLKEIKETKDIMESASLHDFLTGLPNRSKFMKDLEQIIEDRQPCTVMMIDIDDFKKINDTMGHTAGDDALKQVAGRLKEMQSQILTAYRFAGDEFIVILQSNQNMLVEKTAYQMRQIFGKTFTLNGEKKKICGSIGIASYPKDTDNLEQLIVCADDAMYHVKKNGKNDFAFYQNPEEDKS